MHKRAGIKILSGPRQGTVVFPLGEQTTLGRLESVDVFLPDVRCSRRHAQIVWNGSGYVLVDLSSNGTFINERLVTNQERVLKSGDTLGMGATRIEFRLAAAPAPTRGNQQPVPTPALAADAESIDFVFDFSDSDDTPSGGLANVFDTSQRKRLSNTATQAMQIPNEDDLS